MKKIVSHKNPIVKNVIVKKKKALSRANALIVEQISKALSTGLE